MTTTTRLRYAVRSAAAVTSLLLLAGCGGSTGSDATDSPAAQSNSAPAASRTLTVFAAASLQKPFERIGQDFERSHPGVTVRFSFGGSSGLVAQLSDGAPADVLATADERTMARAVEDDLMKAEPSILATNRLSIVVERGNPQEITDVARLAEPELKVVLCAPEVPCGAAAHAVEQAAGVDIRPVSEEQSVTDVLGKVRSGEADAGLVYATDILGARGEVTGIDFPGAGASVNRYPIGTLRDATDPALADAFVNSVLGVAGESVLRAAGFQIPEAQ